MRLSTFDIKAATLLAKIFGDKPFEIVLVRSKAAENESIISIATGEPQSINWRWDVRLPLDSPELTELFKSMVLNCVQSDDDDQPAAITMTANPTNIGDEVHFTCSNASFRKRGKRRLMQAFKRANEAWTKAKEALAWTWNNGGLPRGLVKQVSMLSLTDPLLANNLRIDVRRVEKCSDCHTHHLPNEHPLFAIFEDNLEIPAVVKLCDKDSALSKSPYGKAIFKALKLLLIELTKQGMGEFMKAQQMDLLGDLLPETLISFANNIDAMKEMGVAIEIDPTLHLLILTLQTHVDDKTIINKVKLKNGDQVEPGSRTRIVVATGASPN